MSHPKDWALEYDDAAPPLPEEIPNEPLLAKLLPEGAYFIWIDPKIAKKTVLSPTVFAGILRIHHGESCRNKERNEAGADDTRQELSYRILRRYLRLNGEAKQHPRGMAAEFVMSMKQSSTPGGKQSSTPERYLSGSGDLYSCSRERFVGLKESLKDPELAEQQNEGARLEKLHFPGRDHRYYLRLEAGSPEVKGWNIGFDTWVYGGSNRGWHRGQPITCQLVDDADERRAREGKKAATYEIRNSVQTNVAELGLIRITMGKLRHAELRIDTPQLRHAELITGVPKGVIQHGGNDGDIKWDNHLGRLKAVLGGPEADQPWERWKKALGEARWSLSDIWKDIHGKYLEAERARGKGDGKGVESATSQSATQKIVANKAVESAFVPSDGKWTRHQLKEYHRNFLDKGFRDSDDPATDKDPWVYHFLIVDTILHGGDKVKGLMYDVGGVRRNDPPRQGAAIAIESILEERHRLDPVEDLVWTALHELGHMQGLYHNPVDKCLMQPEHGDNKIEHSPIDRFRLMHLPDLWVRPGGIPYAYRYRASAVDVLAIVPESPGLELEIKSTVVSLGQQPAELILTLKNHSIRGILCPNSRHVQPEKGRIGLSLLTPSGKQQEILPTRFPRKLAGFEGTSLLHPEEIQYRIPWDDAWARLGQVGLYSLHAHLLWYVEKPSKAANLLLDLGRGDDLMGQTNGVLREGGRSADEKLIAKLGDEIQVLRDRLASAVERVVECEKDSADEKLMAKVYPHLKCEKDSAASPGGKDTAEGGDATQQPIKTRDETADPEKDDDYEKYRVSAVGLLRVVQGDEF